MSLWIKTGELLENYNEIWDKVNNTIKEKDLIMKLHKMKNI